MKTRKNSIIILITLSAGVVARNTTNSEDLLMGTGNTASSVSGQLGIIGTGNLIKAKNTLIVGDYNKVSENAANTAEEVLQSLVVGGWNQVRKGTGGRGRNLVSGNGNTLDGSNCFVTGFGNTVESSIVGGITYQSAAIGSSNHIMSDRGYAIGQQNEVTGYRGIAMGTGGQAKNSESTALGRYNAEMESNDILVVGVGTSTATADRSTALRVTSDGGVILGRAQGDISMGDYQ